jgi:hypothetical protein
MERERCREGPKEREERRGSVEIGDPCRQQQRCETRGWHMDEGAIAGERSGTVRGRRDRLCM